MAQLVTALLLVALAGASAAAQSVSTSQVTALAPGTAPRIMQLAAKYISR